MNDFETEKLEKMLKGLRPVAPSEKFFAKTETALAAGTDADELLDSLKKLNPRAPSETFFKKVAAELADENAAREPEISAPKRGLAIPFPRWLSAAAAATLAATGLLIWQHPNTEENPARGGLAENAETENFSAELERPNYRLVSTESSLNDVQELPIETRDDGTLVRPLRYIYTSTNRWEDPDTNRSFVEHRPYEKIVPTLVAVY